MSLVLFNEHEYFFLAFCVFALTLASASLASDFIVLYSKDDKKLELDYGSNFVCYIILSLSAKQLNSQIYIHKFIFYR